MGSSRSRLRTPRWRPWRYLEAASKLRRCLRDSAWPPRDLSGSALSAWNGFLVLARTPSAIVEKLANAVIAASKDVAVIEQLSKLGVESNGTTPEEFSAQIAREQPQFELAMRAANLSQP